MAFGFSSGILMLDSQSLHCIFSQFRCFSSQHVGINIFNLFPQSFCSCIQVQTSTGSVKNRYDSSIEISSLTLYWSSSHLCRSDEKVPAANLWLLGALWGTLERILQWHYCLFSGATSEFDCRAKCSSSRKNADIMGAQCLQHSRSFINLESPCFSLSPSSHSHLLHMCCGSFSEEPETKERQKYTVCVNSESAARASKLHVNVAWSSFL